LEIVIGLGKDIFYSTLWALRDNINKDFHDRISLKILIIRVKNERSQQIKHYYSCTNDK